MTILLRNLEIVTTALTIPAAPSDGVDGHEKAKANHRQDKSGHLQLCRTPTAQGFSLCHLQLI